MDPAPVTVRRFEAGDLPWLMAGAAPGDRRHHEERSGMQERGEATYLVAWRDGVPCGRVTLLHRSKYPSVRAVLGDVPELNALKATPVRLGTGARLVAAAETRARTMGAARVGLAVAHANTGARRLYVRLGYAEWAHGDVVDRWPERDVDGTVVREHADPCGYLVKDLT
ncbi:GNAT family N-acetyltransferase [Blastococcus sp. SYSU D01042]